MKRAAAKGSSDISILKLQQSLNKEWDKLRFGEIKIEPVANGSLFHVSVMLGQLLPDQVLVEVYAEGINGVPPIRITLTTDSTLGDGGEYAHSALVTTAPSASDFTARIIPNYEGISVPLEDNRILWHH